MQSYEVEHRAHRLAGRPSQTTAKLLQEERRALGRAQHEQRVDRREIDPLIEEVDSEQDGDAAMSKIQECLPAFLPGRCAPDSARRDPSARELAGHKPSMFDADAETQRTHPSNVGDSVA